MRTVDIDIFNPTSIDQAIKELETYKKNILAKTSELVTELAKEGMTVAQINFEQAEYDGTKDVTVTWDSTGEYESAVIASGKTVLFIEFGTGINNPSTHPDPIASQYPHGQYGYKLGRLPNGWRYKGEAGTNGIPDPKHPEYIRTKGNIANQSLYNAEQEVRSKFEEIARRVFADA